jgi:hypothetical protein
MHLYLGPIATTPPVRAIPTEPNTVEMTGWDDTSLKLSKVQGGVYVSPLIMPSLN